MDSVCSKITAVDDTMCDLVGSYCPCLDLAIPNRMHIVFGLA
jgi:hypothetical protein